MRIRVIKTTIKAIFSLILISVLYNKIGSESLQIILQQANPTKIVYLVLLLCILIIVQATRWWLIGKKLGFSWQILTTIELSFIGNFFNQLLPGSAGGDAMRAWKLTQSGIPIRLAVSSVIIDRISALIAIGLIFCLGLPLFGEVLSQNFASINMKHIFLTLIAILVMLGLVFWSYSGFQSIKESRIVILIRKFVCDAKEIFLSPIILFEISLLSLIIQIALGYIVWLIAIDFGANFNFFEFIALWSIVLVVSMLPISIAGWGVREGAMVAAFHILGAQSSIALATSILFGLLLVIASLPGGVIWLFSSFRKHKIELN